ncbi:MAG TPA: HAD family hydrolase [Gammaproteobacteria bacterium]
MAVTIATPRRGGDGLDGGQHAALRPAVFFDKDGTLIEDVPYNVAVDRVRLAPGAERALPALARAGFALVVVSNQSGVARGFFAEADVRAVGRRLAALFAELGARLDGFYWCPHHPEGAVPRYRRECACRKPRPGLLLRAAGDLGLDLRASWLVGDILDDIEAGRRAGCRTVLLDIGNETEWRVDARRLPHHVVADLAWAAGVILAHEPTSAPRPVSLVQTSNEVA